MEELVAKMPDVATIMAEMAAVNPEEILQDHRPYVVILKDGTVRRFFGLAAVPPSPSDPLTGVSSKDVAVSPDVDGVYVRVYVPPKLEKRERVPLVVYFHGGAFSIEHAASPVYNGFLNNLAVKAKVLIVSVNYRLAPEFPVPIAYDDSWLAINWVAKQEDTDIREHADLSRMFFAGDSAGANISHQMAKRIGKNPINELKLQGIILYHPYFWGEERIGSEVAKLKNRDMPGELWKLVCPEGSGSDDPRMNPAKDSELGELTVERVLVFVAEHDSLRDRGVHYKEALEKSGWKGEVKVVETMDEGHVFHLFKPTSDKADGLMKHAVNFISKL